MIVGITLCALALAVRGQASHFSIESSSNNYRTERVAVTIEGMHCNNCAAGVKAMLKRTPGVIGVEVSYREKQAVVDYDSEKTTPEKIVEAINNLGYRASIKSKA